jgi:hypothetical protein
MKQRRTFAPPGVSYVDAFRGLVTIEDDVLGVKRQIEERWPSLEVAFDKDRLVWMIIEHGDTRHSLVFETSTLDGRVIERIEKADQQSPNSIDFLDAMDKVNEEIERDRDRRFSDQIGDFGERFLHALKQDGVRDHEDVYGTRARHPARILNR